MTSHNPQMTTPVQVVLLGFMGAGKSTVGPILAEILGWQFYDADKVLEHRAGCTIAELFTRDGETAFRRLEESTVAELLELDGTVVALGGGAIESPSTRSLIVSRRDLYSVFLDGTLDILLDRCNRSETVRPLLQDRDGIEARYKKRLPHYRRATITISTEDMTPQMIANAISEQVQGTKLNKPQHVKECSS